MPSGSIHQHHTVGLAGNVFADLIDVDLHRPCVGAGQHDRCTGIAAGADGAEQIGILVALIGWKSWAGALSGPDAGATILLAKPGFVLEPDFYRGTRWQMAYVGLQDSGEVFLNASITRTSCLGCCGRPEMRENPNCLSR